jgi:hypothetical protein
MTTILILTHVHAIPFLPSRIIGLRDNHHGGVSHAIFSSRGDSHTVFGELCTCDMPGKAAPNHSVRESRLCTLVKLACPRLQQLAQLLNKITEYRPAPTAWHAHGSLVADASGWLALY